MSATLRSNDGEGELTIDFGSPEKYAADAGVTASVRIRGRHWDGDHTHDLSASIEGLWLRARDLVELRDAVAAWLARPLNELTTSNLDGQFVLTRLPGQNLVLRFGPRPESMRGHHPEVSVSLAAGPFRGDFHLVTDQSCLVEFRRELSSELAELTG